MKQAIGQMMDAYDSGRMTRREVMAGLGGLVAALAATGGKTASAQTQSTFVATELNHVALRVTDVPRARDFYIKHLGLKVDREILPIRSFLTCGNGNFLALFQGGEARMDHYCFSIEDFDVHEVEAKLKDVGIEPRVVRGDGRIYFDDLDGHEVQLAAKNHTPTMLVPGK